MTATASISAEEEQSGPVVDSTSKSNITDVGKTQESQIGLSRTHPGLYLYGSNAFGVVNPESAHISEERSPAKFGFFDGWGLRDVALAEAFGAALDSSGNLFVWGKGFRDVPHVPQCVLRGNDLTSITCSNHHVFALSKKGRVFVIPASESAQSGWMGGKSSGKAFKELAVPRSSGKVTSIASGLGHVAAVTSKGQLLSLSQITSTSTDFEFKVIPDLKNVDQVACGDNHVIARTTDGNSVSFGSNVYGQLAHSLREASLIQYVDAPTPVSFSPNLRIPAPTPYISSVAAGGNVSMMVAENGVYAVGNGIYGQLGNASFNHVQVTPVAVRNLSGLTQFNEKTGQVVPVKVWKVVCGPYHCVGVLETAAKTKDCEIGRDVLTWGNNKEGELGLGQGKKGNFAVAVNPPMIRYAGMDASQDEGRMQLAGNGFAQTKDGKVAVEQDVAVGGAVTAVYSKVLSGGSWFRLW